MKAFLFLLFFAFTFSATAADRRRGAKQPKPDSVAAAVNYSRAFYTELNGEVTLLHPFAPGGFGVAGTLHTCEWTYRVPADKFPAKQLYEIAFRAHQQWHINWTGWGGNSGGLSGGTNRFCAQAGTHGASVFIDVIAYTEDAETVIVVLARCAQ